MNKNIQVDFQICISAPLNNNKSPSLKLFLVIERRKQARKHPQELFCKVRAPRNL